jgi:hypothetical protein
MKLKEIVQFEMIDFDELDIPEFVKETEDNYNLEMEKSNYVLEQNQYDEYASRWARVGDWYNLQYARAVYNETNMENQINELYDTNKPRAPIECKSDASKRRWVQQNTSNFYDIANKYDRAKGYLAYFENKLKTVDKNHYLCKGMSSSIDKSKGTGGFC